jgi:hypothetical protein
MKEKNFARACTVEMHINMSQEPLQAEFKTKKDKPQTKPRKRTQTQTRQNWIFSEIHQELSPETCKLVMKTTIKRRTFGKGDVLQKDIHDQNNHQVDLENQKASRDCDVRVLGLALCHDNEIPRRPNVKTKMNPKIQMPLLGFSA